MRIALLVLVACSSPAPPTAPPTAPPKPPDAPTAAAIPPTVAAAVTCETTAAWRPSFSFKQSAHVLHLRVAAAAPGPTIEHSRCVALDLEIVDAFRGGDRVGDHVKVVVKQSMIEHYTSRPAGAWWIVEQSLEPGSEYVALCPSGPLADVLRAECSVSVAAPHLANLVLLRDAVAQGLDGVPLIAKLRTTCAIADELVTGYVWEQTGKQALTDLAIFDALLSVVTERTCSTTARAMMLDVVSGVAMTADKPAHVARVARAMFALLGMPEAAGLHDNLIGTFLPNALGLDGGLTKLKATQVFSGDPKGRATAAKLLADYQGDATKLRAWIK